MWWLLIPVVMEGRDYLEEVDIRKSLEKLAAAHLCDDDGILAPGTAKTSDWVLVIRRLPDSRLILHARATARDGARSSDAVREYYCDPHTGSLKNRTLRQAFGWKANLRY
ncbi:hypothetical protein [Streptomyces sp. BK239]|uniref:hypothetical protein n=1 Tax=Streptomyces sp. BK239 TaxID=2512155 RepID=UPI00102C6AC3|nr:hypothetical protein [Streptomyces sp. BK239]RZU18291.1 hypothetical protein EV567_3227 [Streptomyces sp. BK239]